MTLLREKNAVIMGKTNVPEFAAGWVSANYANGRTLNPYDHRLTTGGSSGGSASAVATYVAPVAVTEDTGGSTRHPAMQCQNFGYDPSRNHYPNAGNPGLSYTNDQVGLNARSLEDILVLDAALLGTEEQHASKARASRPAPAIRVGLPRFPFVEVAPFENGKGVRDYTPARVSAELEARYEAAIRVLGQAGTQLVREEWPEVESPVAGGPVNAVAEALCGSVVNGVPVSITGIDMMHSAGVQMQDWISSYLEAAVSNVEIMEDIMPMGRVSAGGILRGLQKGATDETRFRFLMSSQARLTDVWNSYFETHEVDVIVTPPQFADAVSYADAARCTVPVRRPRADVPGGFEIVGGSLSGSNTVSYMAFKNIAIPKLMVPTGCDAHGRPTAVAFWGRAVPAEKLYDDAYVRLYDLDFLYTVRPLVEALQADPTTRRVDAPLVSDLFPPR